MAPKKRSNRAQRVSKSTVAGTIGEACHTSKVKSLPEELWLEIGSHVPSMPLPTEYSLDGNTEHKGYEARHMTFLTLTMTCRSFRRIFMKYLWQRIEVIDGMRTPRERLPSYAFRTNQNNMGLKAQRFAQELLRQLKIVTKRQPSYAQHVREMNIVFLPNAGQDSILKDVAEYVTALPNLRTVQLVFNAAVSISTSEILEQYTFPQVTTLSISHPLHGHYRNRGVVQMGFLVASCPGLRRLAPCMNDACLTSVFDAPNLEVVGPLFLPKREVFEILKSTKLRDISIHCANFNDSLWKIEYLEPLRKLKHLYTIRIGVHEDTLSRTPEEYKRRLQSWVEYCRGLLSGHRNRVEDQVPVNRQVIVVFYSRSGKPRFETHDVY